MLQVSFTLYNLRHTLHYLRMHCAVTKLHFAELFKHRFVQAAILRFHNGRHRLHYVNSILQSVVLLYKMQYPQYSLQFPHPFH